MPRTIAVGDIHGCAAALATLLEVVAPEPDDTVVPLGDYGWAEVPVELDHVGQPRRVGRLPLVIGLGKLVVGYNEHGKGEKEDAGEADHGCAKAFLFSSMNRT